MLMSRLFVVLVVGAGAVALAHFGNLVFHYLLQGGYLNHTEAKIAELAWGFLRGEQLYRDIAAPDYVINMYGPLLYDVQAAVFALAGGSVFASKLPAIGATVGSVVLLTVYVVRRWGIWPGLLGTAMMAGLLLHNLPFAYWAQSDPLLLLLVTVALVLIGGRPPRLSAYLVLGVCGGLLVNLKVYTPVYLLPLIVELWLAEGEPRRLVRGLAVAGLIGLVVAVLPWLAPNASLLDNLAGVKAVASPRGRLDYFRVVEKSLFYLLPVLLAATSWLLVRRRPSLAEAMPFATFTVTVILVWVPATMPGAGPSHLLPLAPLACALLSQLAAKVERPWLQPVAAVAAAVVMMTALPQQKRHAGSLSNLLPKAAETEVAVFAARHKGESVGMGWGEYEHYSHTFVGPELVFAGSPVLPGAITFMELKASRLPYPTGALAGLSECKPRHWLIPKNDRPFIMVSYYPGGEIVNQTWRDTFLRNYDKSESLEYFDVWSCQR
jgi:hypothetical protein